MPVTQSSEPSCEKPSPFANLNGELGVSNERLSELVYRLGNKLHRLSDTNVPTAQNDVKEGLPELPFRDGHLMDYYFKVNNYNHLLRELLVQVEKVEALI